MRTPFSSEIVLQAYRKGYFPMAEPWGTDIFWHFPEPRAIIPLEAVNVPRSMRKIFRNKEFTFSVNERFEDVIAHCAARRETWISEDIVRVYTEMRREGWAHSVEVYSAGGELVGGLYGVAIGAAFFGESMFNLVPNAAKAAFYYLIARLIDHGFILLDSQYINDFTRQLGAVEIPSKRYLELLAQALSFDVKFA